MVSVLRVLLFSGALLLPAAAFSQESDDDSAPEEEDQDEDPPPPVGAELDALEGAPADVSPPFELSKPSEPDAPSELGDLASPAGPEAVRLLSNALDRIAALEILLGNPGGGVDRERALSELEEARRALQSALIEVGRLQQDDDLRAWLRAQGLFGAEPEDVPPEPAAQTADLGVPSDRFQSIVASIESVSFTEGKMQVLTRELADDRVTSAQASALVELFSFSRDHVDALVFLHPRIIDTENFDSLLSALKFESDRETVRNQLGLGG